ncbi:velvet factor-domain-containing protein [Rhodocollybia butyracea]|uniref:Velvet factor-domain-containing protein n=1 Tax=Rhodocollybia butyracea TaxID=206335 RepID=A0A9P5QA60_9AGAR|nr:velvet factor-domain-containing protein [Rhodocollybia butyracea]
MSAPLYPTLHFPFDGPKGPNSTIVTRPVDETVYPIGEFLTNQPICFEAGQWKERTIRAELTELQHADRVRKYAEVDRRTLDPPPVVALRLYETFEAGYYCEEREITDYEDIQLIGLICAVELVPVSEPHCSQMIPAVSKSRAELIPRSSLKLPVNPRGRHSPVSYPNANLMFFDEFGDDAASNRIYEASNDYSLYTTSTSSACKYEYSAAEYDITPSVAQIAELTDTTLIGSKVVQPHLIDIDNQKTLLFVFSDLSVRELGLFKLRYKFFDLFSSTPGNPCKIIQAECTGGTFRVFSTKDFPGLCVSTPLTKVCFFTDDVLII